MHGNVKMQSRSLLAAAMEAGHVSGQTVMWLVTFPVAAAFLFAVQPSAFAATVMAIGLSVFMAGMARLACDPSTYEKGSHTVALLAPVLSALFILIAAYLGRQFGGESHTVSAMMASLALAGLYAVDALVTGAGLLAFSRGSAAAAAPVAVLVNAKYSGLFGRIL